MRLGLGAGDAVHAGRAAGGLVEAGAAVLGATTSRRTQLSDGGLAAIRAGGLALGQLAVGVTCARAEAKTGDNWEGRQTVDTSETDQGRVGELRRLGVRVGGAAGAMRSDEALGVAGGRADVDAAVDCLSAGARLHLDSSGRASERANGLSLDDVAARLALSAAGTKAGEGWDGRQNQVASEVTEGREGTLIGLGVRVG